MMRTFKTLAAILSLTLLGLCPPASAEDVYIYAPDYTAANDAAGIPLSVDAYGWLHGMDSEGEWLEYEFDLEVSGEHAVGLLVKGEMDVDFNLRMEVSGGSEPLVKVLDFNFTGTGFTG
jgi:hypothetical protein